MLEFKAEKLDQLKGRFKAAVDRAWDPDKITDSKSDRPGLHREHVFDFKDGTRLIISKDQIEGNLFLHVSGSYHDKKCGRASIDGKKMVERMLTHLFELTKVKQDTKGEAMATEGGIIHILFAWEDHIG